MGCSLTRSSSDSDRTGFTSFLESNPGFYARGMNRGRVVSLLLAGLLITSVTGCTKSATGQKPTPAMLSDALPSITDMPGSWSETQRQVFDERGVENPSIDPSVWCDEASQVAENLIALAGEAGADVEMEAEVADGGARMMRLQAWSNDDVSAYVTDVAEAVGICDGRSVTDRDGVSRSWEVIDDRQIGDESVSWIETTVPPEDVLAEKFSSIGRTTVARFGDLVMVLQLGDANFSGRTEPMAEEDWWTIVELAGQRLDDLDEQVHE